STPLDAIDRTKLWLGLYVQDQWTHKRLTTNLGLRYDYANGYIPAYSTPAGRYSQALDIPRTDNLPNYKDLSPRLGVSYDIFGNGKTAIKGSFGRYEGILGDNIQSLVHPKQDIGSALGTSDTRSWTDLNGDFIAQPGELGPTTNVNFGTSKQ